MTPEQFTYWLQGHVEINPTAEAPTPEQWKIIKDHLQTVFKKVTPPFQQLGPGQAGFPVKRDSGLSILPGAGLDRAIC